ncbi:MAG: DUF3592 domain-containing protein [Candidatus Omnitrophota bacterium]
MRRRKQGIACLRLFGFVILLFYGLIIKNQVKVYLFFNMTEGEIIDAYINDELIPDDNYYFPVVEYSYIVNGKVYENNRIGVYRFGFGSRFRAQKWIDKYPIHMKVPVYYNPQKPQSSVLLCGLISPYIKAMFGLMLLLLSLWLSHNERAGGKGNVLFP